jgi:periplasmic protein TonB
MNDALLDFPHEIPEWRRIGRFFAVAIGLHLAVLLYPLAPTISRLEIPPPATVMVRLVDTVALPTPMPVQAAPAVVPKVTPTPVRERRAVAPRPVIVMQPEQAVPAANFSVPAVVASDQVPTAESAPAMASPAVTAARFEAAYLHNPRPDYPPLSRRLGEEGKVLLRVRVSREGQPAAVDLEKSSNFARLDEAARAVVAHWRFVPARRDDEAIDATVIVPIVFRLDG